MTPKEYVDLAKELLDQQLPRELVITIIQEFAKDKRTELMEKGKSERIISNDKDKPTKKQLDLLSKWKVDTTNLSRKEASKIIDEKLKKINSV